MLSSYAIIMPMKKNSLISLLHCHVSVVWLPVFYVSLSRYHGLVCGIHVIVAFYGKSRMLISMEVVLSKKSFHINDSFLHAHCIGIMVS